MSLECKNYCYKQDLIGFRQPADKELEIMQSIVLKELWRTNGAILFWYVFCLISWLCFLLSIISKLSSLDSELLIHVPIFLILSLICKSLQKSWKEQKSLVSYIRAGKVEVLDCMVYEGESHTRVAGIGLVKIFTKDGQYCSENFRIAEDIAATWENDNTIQFVLMRCISKDYYKLFPKSKIEI